MKLRILLLHSFFSHATNNFKDFKVIFLVIPRVESVLFLSTAILSLISLTPVVLFFFEMDNPKLIVASFMWMHHMFILIHKCFFPYIFVDKLHFIMRYFCSSLQMLPSLTLWIILSAKFVTKFSESFLHSFQIHHQNWPRVPTFDCYLLISYLWEQLTSGNSECYSEKAIDN